MTISRSDGPPDIVPDVAEERLREIYGKDAVHVVAMRRFLTHDKGDRPIELPPHWYDWALGKIDSEEVLRRDDESARREG